MRWTQSHAMESQSDDPPWGLGCEVGEACNGPEGWGYIAKHPLKLKRRCEFWEGTRESQRSRSALERLQSLRRNKTCVQGNICTGSVIHAIWMVPADCCVVWEGEAGHANCGISTCQLLPILSFSPSVVVINARNITCSKRRLEIQLFFK